MKYLITLFIACILLSCNQTSTKIGKYNKASLPSDFLYKILEDKSNDALEKNELAIEINKKISIEQIATLADELFSSKKKQRRFYIFYLLPDMKIGSGAWATSHFDPELEIQIIGATTEQENTMKKTANSVDGEIIGKWYEEQYTKSTYVLFKKENKIFLRTLFSNGQTNDDEMVIIEKGQKKVEYKKGGYNGEYFILNADNTLGFYNSEDKNFTTAKIVE